MSTDFDNLFAAYAAPALFASDGETITITPSGGSASTVTRRVIRDPLQPVGPTAETMNDYPITVWVYQADLPTVTIGADTIAVGRRKGDSTLTTYTVKEILDQTGGQWHLRLK